MQLLKGSVKADKAVHMCGAMAVRVQCVVAGHAYLSVDAEGFQKRCDSANTADGVQEDKRAAGVHGEKVEQDSITLVLGARYVCLHYFTCYLALDREICDLQCAMPRQKHTT